MVSLAAFIQGCPKAYLGPKQDFIFPLFIFLPSRALWSHVSVYMHSDTVVLAGWCCDSSLLSPLQTPLPETLGTQDTMKQVGT